MGAFALSGITFGHSRGPNSLQLFAVQRARAIRQEALRAKQRKREFRGFFWKDEPETQRTMTTRYGRTATALSSYFFCEVEEDDPAQSGTWERFFFFFVVDVVVLRWMSC